MEQCPKCGAQKTTTETTIHNNYKIITTNFSCGSQKVVDTIGGFWHENFFGPCSKVLEYRRR